MGSRGGRKIQYAPVLVDALDLDRIPWPLDAALGHWWRRAGRYAWPTSVSSVMLTPTPGIWRWCRLNVRMPDVTS